jgi:hypothetical protein
MKQEETYFEQFVKESIDGYKMYPSTKTWQNISKQINNNIKPTLFAVFILALLTLFTFNFNSNSTSNTVSNNFAFQLSNQNSGTVYFSKMPTIIESSIAEKKSLNQINEKINLATNFSVANINADIAQQVFTNENKNSVSVNKYFDKELFEKENNKTALATDAQDNSNVQNETPISVYTEENVELIAEQLEITNSTKALSENKNQQIVKQKETTPVVPNIEKLTKESKKSIVQVYVTPGLSYRQLYDKRNDVYNIPFAAQSNNSADINASVFHKPATALEIGVAWVKPITKSLEFKTAVQANYNSYKIKTAEAQSQVATIALTGNNTQVNRVTNLVNAESANPKWIENTQLQISMPIGLNFLITNSKRIKIGVGSSVQPALTVYNKTLLLSTDLKNYATAPYLIRKVHINGALEPFIAIKGKKLQWQMGPQLRYQFMSTYAKTYPFKENMFDYGFKIGIGKNF